MFRHEPRFTEHYDWLRLQARLRLLSLPADSSRVLQLPQTAQAMQKMAEKWRNRALFFGAAKLRLRLSDYHQFIIFTGGG